MSINIPCPLCDELRPEAEYRGVLWNHGGLNFISEIRLCLPCRGIIENEALRSLRKSEVAHVIRLLRGKDKL